MLCACAYVFSLHLSLHLYISPYVCEYACVYETRGGEKDKFFNWVGVKGETMESYISLVRRGMERHKQKRGEELGKGEKRMGYGMGKGFFFWLGFLLGNMYIRSNWYITIYIHSHQSISYIFFFKKKLENQFLMRILFILAINQVKNKNKNKNKP